MPKPAYEMPFNLLLVLIFVAGIVGFMIFYMMRSGIEGGPISGFLRAVIQLFQI